MYMIYDIYYTHTQDGKASKGKPNQTKSAVRNSMLYDLVHPHIVAGKRIRMNADQSTLLKVFLSSMDTAKLEDKLKVYSTIFSELTKQRVEFLIYQ